MREAVITHKAVMSACVIQGLLYMELAALVRTSYLLIKYIKLKKIEFTQTIRNHTKARHKVDYYLFHHNYDDLHNLITMIT